MKRPLILVAALLAVACLATTPLHAGGYVGASYGESSADLSQSDVTDDGSLSSFKIEDSDSAWKVFGGWHTKWVGVEAAWQDLGSFSIDAESDGSGPIYQAGDIRYSLESRGLSAELLGRIPLGGVIAIFGKVGAFWWNSETITQGPVVQIKSDNTGFDLMYGAGVDIIIKKIAFRLEYEKFDKVSNADTSIDLASAGIMFNF
jgi:hypothetical protein